MSENLSNKTCGECSYYVSDLKRCNMRKIFYNIQATDTGCRCFAPQRKHKPTNGDVISHGGNRAIAEFVDKVWKCPCEFCVYAKYIEDYGFGEGGFDCKKPDEKDCVDGFEAWLNAPADCVAENGESAKQADLCCKSAKESEGEDE